MTDPVPILLGVLLGFGLALLVTKARGSAKPAAATPPPPAQSSLPGRLLVPVTATEHSDRGLELACRLARGRRALIFLTYVIEVPRNMPLGTPMPEEEERAVEALGRAEAQARACGVRYETRIERARSLGEGILKTAGELGVDSIVVGTQLGHEPLESWLGNAVEALLRRAPCEVVVARAALPNRGT